MGVKFRRLWIQLTSDRKRFSLLCAVALVGLLLWTRLIVVSNLPRTAVADEAQASASEKSAPGEKQGPINQRPVITTELDAAPARDPFVISPVHFPRSTALVDIAQEAGKSQPQGAENAEQAQARRSTHLRALAERLTLDATMAGGAMAVISGKTYRQGDTIATAPESEGFEPVKFLLAEVRQRSVILECDHWRFELKMATP